jgi:hypothetical protein
MSFDELIAEIKRLKLSVKVSTNGAGPHLEIEPKASVAPELVEALRVHKQSLIDYINNGTAGLASVFPQVRAVLAGLPTETPDLEDLGAPLRKIGDLIADCDALTRQLIRAEVIDALNVRKVKGAAKIVDALLAGVAIKEVDETGRRLLLEDVKPWPEPVDGASLLDAIDKAFKKYVVVSTHGATTFAIWCLHTHAIDGFDLSPYLVLESPEMRSGKTTTLAVVQALVPRPVPASNISAAALFRVVEKYAPTLLVDEADSFVGDNEELRGVLNSGHTRATAYVVRTVGDNHEPRLFGTFGPKVIALIGTLTATLQDRSIAVPMRRKTKAEKVTRLRIATLTAEFETVRRMAARWAADNIEALRTSDPEIPDAITSDRAVDNWRPLLAIADLAGGPWPEQARQAAVALSGDADEDAGDQTIGVQLLVDIKALFERDNLPALSTDDVLAYLATLAERPWPTMARGKTITAMELSALLRPFGVRPKQFRRGSDKLRGYVLKGPLEDAFTRYTPSSGEITSSKPVQPVQVNENAELWLKSHPVPSPSVPGQKNDISARNYSDVPGVPSSDHEIRPEEVVPGHSEACECPGCLPPGDEGVPF